MDNSATFSVWKTFLTQTFIRKLIRLASASFIYSGVFTGVSNFTF